MSTIFSWVIDIVIILIVMFILYLLVNYINQYNRLKKRYDNLLRGRGNLNMEELLQSYGADISKNQKDLDSIKEQVDDISAYSGIDKESIERNFGDLFNRIDKEYQIQFAEANKKNELGLSQTQTELRNRIETLNRQLDEVELRLKNEITTMSRNSNTQIKETSTGLITRMDNLENSVNFDLSETKKEITNDINNTKETLNKSMDKTNKDFNEILERTTKDLNSDIKIIEERLEFAIQKVGLHRYDAFDNLSNKLSYSLAMLDNHNDGIILTSIFGRNGSSIYAKEVKAGKSEKPLSPEEDIALDMAITKK